MTRTIAVYHGSIINPEILTSYKALPRGLLAVNDDGFIDWLIEDIAYEHVQHAMLQNGAISADLHLLKPGEFIMPGFVDTHTHAPQVPNTGSGGQYQLLDWLENVTFPMESKFKDKEFARSVYNSVVKRYINCGTTSCCYYATIHVPATEVLGQVVVEKGQRAFVGKCNMNRNSPDHYCEPSSTQSITDTLTIINFMYKLRNRQPKSLTQVHRNAHLIHPILTPRFAISCSDTLLAMLGQIAKDDPTLMIQTHISENKAEIAFTKELFPTCESYAAVYDKFKLLNERTILAHAVWLDEKELDLVRDRKAGISHCPTSNFNLNSGMARVGEMLDRGIKVGLGTDVSGGYSHSILTAIQHASICSKMVSLQPPMELTTTSSPEQRTFTNQPLSIPTLLYLATMGGAEVCNLSNVVGSFAPTKAFDALIVSVRPEAGNGGITGIDQELNEGIVDEEKLKKYLEKFLFCGDDRNIAQVFVQGKWVGGALFPN